MQEKVFEHLVQKDEKEIRYDDQKDYVLALNREKEAMRTQTKDEMLTGSL